jgi:hypothetical protein
MEKKGGGEFIAKRKEKSKLENGFPKNNNSVTKCFEWTYIPIRTIRIMKIMFCWQQSQQIRLGMEGGTLLSKNVSICKMWGLTNSGIKQHLDEI